MKRLTLLSVIILTIMITIHPLQTSTMKYIAANKPYFIEGYPLTIEIDPTRGGAIVSYKFTPTNRTIHNQIYLGEQWIVDAVALDIVPPAMYLDEPTPTDWWPGYSINTMIKPQLLNSTTYVKYISLEYPVGPHRVELTKIIKYYMGKPYIDIYYKFINIDQKPVKIDLTSSWGRPVSFSILLGSRFGDDNKDDHQVYGLTNKTIIERTYYSSWGAGGKPDTAPGKIAFIALFSSREDYKDYGEALILVPLGKTIDETYGVWFEINGMNVPGVEESTTIRLELRAFTIEPGEYKVFKFRLYMGPAVKWMIDNAGLSEYTRDLVSRGLVYETRIPQYDQPPYTLKIVVGSETLPRLGVRITRLLDNGLEKTIYDQHIDSTTTTITVNEPGIYRITLYDTRGVTIDNKYEYTVTSLNGKPDTNTITIPVYSSETIHVAIRLREISWVKLLLIDEEGNPLELGNKSIEITFIGSGSEKDVSIQMPEYTLYLPVGTYDIYIQPISLSNRTLSDIYIDDKYTPFDKIKGKAYIQLGLNEPGKLYEIKIKYVPSGAVVGEPPLEIFLITLIGVILILIVVVIIATRRRRP